LHCNKDFHSQRLATGANREQNILLAFPVQRIDDSIGKLIREMRTHNKNRVDDTRHEKTQSENNIDNALNRLATKEHSNRGQQNS